MSVFAIFSGDSDQDDINFKNELLAQQQANEEAREQKKRIKQQKQTQAKQKYGHQQHLAKQRRRCYMWHKIQCQMPFAYDEIRVTWDHNNVKKITYGTDDEDIVFTLWPTGDGNKIRAYFEIVGCLESKTRCKEQEYGSFYEFLQTIYRVQGECMY